MWVHLGVDYSLTRSCYDPDAEGLACGHCDACQLRLEGFKLAGAKDPGPMCPQVDRARVRGVAGAFGVPSKLEWWTTAPHKN